MSYIHTHIYINVQLFGITTIEKCVEEGVSQWSFNSQELVLLDWENPVDSDRVI